jgi:hypothetical protein
MSDGYNDENGSIAETVDMIVAEIAVTNGSVSEYVSLGVGAAWGVGTKKTLSVFASTLDWRLCDEGYDDTWHSSRDHSSQLRY